MPRTRLIGVGLVYFIPFPVFLLLSSTFFSFSILEQSPLPDGEIRYVRKLKGKGDLTENVSNWMLREWLYRTLCSFSCIAHGVQSAVSHRLTQCDRSAVSYTVTSLLLHTLWSVSWCSVCICKILYRRLWQVNCTSLCDQSAVSHTVHCTQYCTVYQVCCIAHWVQTAVLHITTDQL